MLSEQEFPEIRTEEERRSVTDLHIADVNSHWTQS